MTQNQELTSNICHWKRAMNVRYLPSHATDELPGIPRCKESSLCLYVLVCVFTQIWRQICHRDVLGLCVAASHVYTSIGECD